PVADPSGIAAGDMEAALAGSAGRSLQQPPAFSAVKVDGKRAYVLARGGELSRPAAREVEVYSATLVDFQPGTRPIARIEFRCGSGTYLRSIARDLDERLGVGGYLGRLVRQAYGDLTIDLALRIDELSSLDAVPV